MAKRQNEWAKRARAQLIGELGGQCAHCGATEDLAIDHLYGADWPRHKFSSSHRICIYRIEAAEGLLQVLCRRCNSSKGRRPDQLTLQLRPQPDQQALQRYVARREAALAARAARQGERVVA